MRRTVMESSTTRIRGTWGGRCTKTGGFEASRVSPLSSGSNGRHSKPWLVGHTPRLSYGCKLTPQLQNNTDMPAKPGRRDN
jgi:hypothetical protein